MRSTTASQTLEDHMTPRTPPPAFYLAPRLTRGIGYVAAPVVLAVAGGVAWVVQAVTR